MNVLLISRRLNITISDPWEFGTQCGVGPFAANIDDLDDKRLLLRFNHPLFFNKTNLFSAISQLRHGGSSFDDLLVGGALATNLVLLPISPRRLSEILPGQFRKGVAAIGSMKLAGVE